MSAFPWYWVQLSPYVWKHNFSSLLTDYVWVSECFTWINHGYHHHNNGPWEVVKIINGLRALLSGKCPNDLTESCKFLTLFNIQDQKHGYNKCWNNTYLLPPVPPKESYFFLSSFLISLISFFSILSWMQGYNTLISIFCS